MGKIAFKKALQVFQNIHMSQRKGVATPGNLPPLDPPLNYISILVTHIKKQ